MKEIKALVKDIRNGTISLRDVPAVLAAAVKERLAMLFQSLGVVSLIVAIVGTLILVRFA